MRSRIAQEYRQEPEMALGQMEYPRAAPYAAPGPRLGVIFMSDYGSPTGPHP